MKMILVPALVTPVSNKKVDKIGFEKYLSWLQKAGIKRVVLCGSTGEGVGLDLQDYQEMLNIIKPFKMEVILSIANPNPCKVVQIIESLHDNEIFAIMLATPFTTKAKQADMIEYFTQIAAVSKFPILIYNNPARFGLNLTIDSYQQIFAKGNVHGVKECADKTDPLWSQLAELTKQNNITLYAGDDDNWLDLPVDGCISVIGNCFPELGVQLCDNPHDEDARARWQHLCRVSGVALNPLPVKYLLSKAGLITQETFLALCSLTKEQQHIIDDIIGK